VSRATKTEIAVYQIGDFERTELANALSLANHVQESLRFTLESSILRLGGTYRLRNGGFDLNSVAQSHFDSLKTNGLVVYFSAAPYGVPAQGSKKNWFYFTSAGDIAIRVSSS
jgi:hypothetical protein